MTRADNVILYQTVKGKGFLGAVYTCDFADESASNLVHDLLLKESSKLIC
jgi:hypothetical protein